ncbi:hypothetical protein BSL78_07848 [Apostichopus japonicus]|uniref:Nucleotide-diphospho-sugar transferase domain-containing protein n=1 Tax=Stichopus japonicus TaxID=307972 RepID=A0A2G8L4T4_STIJA|nr:hypothetical protein BSL78_07848 [Apostichopus japonicus]
MAARCLGTVTFTCFLIICLELLVILFMWSPPAAWLLVPNQQESSATSTLKTTLEGDNQTFPTVKDMLEHLHDSPLMVTCVNYGFVELLYNLLFSIQRLKIQPNILVICEDKMSFIELSKGRQNLNLEFKIALTFLEESTTKSTRYTSDSYIQLVQKRVYYIELLLRHNIDVLYIDSDIVLLEDPFKFMNGKEDLFIQSETPRKSVVCTGFFYIKANNRTCRLISAWRRALPRDKRGNQRVFNEVLNRFKRQIKVNILPTDRFFSGKIFAASNEPWSKRSPKPVEIHANFMTGSVKKTQTMKNLGLWFIPPSNNSNIL